MPITSYLPRRAELHAAVRTLFDRHTVEEALKTADAWVEAWEVQGKTELAAAIRQASHEEWGVALDRLTAEAEGAEAEHGPDPTARDAWLEVQNAQEAGEARGWEV